MIGRPSRGIIAPVLIHMRFGWFGFTKLGGEAQRTTKLLPDRTTWHEGAKSGDRLTD